MASFDDLARQYTRLSGSVLGHVKRLVGTWGLLADFCFSDLMLFVPVAGDDGGRFVVIGQIRPTTSQTLYREDMLGRVLDELERPLVARAWRLEQITEGEHQGAHGERTRMQCIPVRWKGTLLGVLTRESTPSVGRRPGELERKYVEIFQRFARMISEGEFPFATEEVHTEESPRVGDGVLVLDANGRVEYSSPNAVSALHRIGIHASLDGQRLEEVGFPGSAVGNAFAYYVPITEEVERGGDMAVVVRCIPLLTDGKVDGAVVLMRDISDLRRRDRLLLSKDATIREIHHRVKNNLQTVSSLLRVQARRMDSPEARAALEESVRRIRSIALVHETLSRTPGEEVPFDDILRALVLMVQDSTVSDEHPVHFDVKGHAGELSDKVATQLAVVITELLQNAVEHAFPDDQRVEPGQVVVEIEREAEALVLRVRDDGVGLPSGFDVTRTDSVGLSIIRAMVATDLAGQMTMESDGGTVVQIRVPLAPAA